MTPITNYYSCQLLGHGVHSFLPLALNPFLFSAIANRFIKTRVAEHSVTQHSSLITSLPHSFPIRSKTNTARESPDCLDIIYSWNWACHHPNMWLD